MTENMRLKLIELALADTGCQKPASENLSPLRVGNAVFIRTVTSYFTGRVVALVLPDRVCL